MHRLLQQWCSKHSTVIFLMACRIRCASCGAGQPTARSVWCGTWLPRRAAAHWSGPGIAFAAGEPVLTSRLSPEIVNIRSNRSTAADN